MVKETQNKPLRTDLKTFLRRDGINIALIDKMSYNELLTAYSIDDYEEYNRYMTHIAHMYDI